MAGCMRFMQFLSSTQCAPVFATRTTCHALTDVVSACAGVAASSNVAATVVIQNCPDCIVRPPSAESCTILVGTRIGNALGARWRDKDQNLVPTTVPRRYSLWG